MAYFVYWLTSANRSYVGATVCPERRLRQHNGDLTGGAYRTRDKGPWNFKCVVSGFRTWRESLQFEWAVKYAMKRCRSVTTRTAALNKVIQKERWTSNAPLSSEVSLSVEFDPMQYGRYELSQPSLSESKQEPCRDKHKKRKKRWRQSLYGVTY